MVNHSDTAAPHATTPNTAFAPAVGAWAEGLDGIRNVVRQEVVRRQLAGVTGSLAADLGVLDVGCGQGTQALHLARAGHRVTGLDLSEELLETFRTALLAEPDAVRRRVTLVRGPLETAAAIAPGPYDLVLCHGVLMYFGDAEPVLRELDRVAGPDARLSLLVRNGLAPAMRDGLRGDWPATLDAFDSLDYINRLGVAAHAHTPEQLDDVLGRLGWVRDRWYGVRVFTDHLGDSTPPEWGPTEEGLADLLAAETEAGRRDPYRHVAALLHLVYRRVSPDRP